MRLWGGRFSEANDARVEAFTSSIEIDRELAADDISGSIAHVRGLGRAGLLTGEQVDELVDRAAGARRGRRRRPLRLGPRRSRTSTSTSSPALAERVGPVAGRLHTGRSRNDQVATDLRLWTRRAIDRLDAAIVGFERALVGLAERDGRGRPPGHDPHPAGPARAVRPSPARLRRDGRARPRPARRRPSPPERVAARARARSRARATRSIARATAAELGFDGVTANSLDAVSDRDFVVEVLAAVALGMVHLSRLAEEITWWSNPRFGFVRASDAFSTGSSIMPNKKNPDPAELVRGRAARVIGALTGVLAMLKGLPLAYQRDLQEDKAPLFDAVAVYEASLGVLAGMLETMTVDAERMRAAAAEGYTTATAVADSLVRRGIPFRAAHHVVGSLVAQAETAGVGLDAVDDGMIGMALGASGDPDAAALAEDPGDRRRDPRGGLDRRGARGLRGHRRDRAGTGRRGARGRAGAARRRGLTRRVPARPGRAGRDRRLARVRDHQRPAQLRDDLLRDLDEDRDRVRDARGRTAVKSVNPSAAWRSTNAT